MIVELYRVVSCINWWSRGVWIGTAEVYRAVVSCIESSLVVLSGELYGNQLMLDQVLVQRRRSDEAKVTKPDSAHGPRYFVHFLSCY